VKGSESKFQGTARVLHLLRRWRIENTGTGIDEYVFNFNCSREIWGTDRAVSKLRMAFCRDFFETTVANHGKPFAAHRLFRVFRKKWEALRWRIPELNEDFISIMREVNGFFEFVQGFLRWMNN